MRRKVKLKIQTREESNAHPNEDVNEMSTLHYSINYDRYQSNIDEDKLKVTGQ